MTLLWPRWEGIILTLNLFRNKSKKDAISKMLNLKWFDLTGRSSPTTSSEQKQVPAFEEHMLNDPNGGCGRLSIGLAACLGYGIRPQKWHITFAHHLETFLLSFFSCWKGGFVIVVCIVILEDLLALHNHFVPNKMNRQDKNFYLYMLYHKKIKT